MLQGYKKWDGMDRVISALNYWLGYSLGWVIIIGAGTYDRFCLVRRAPLPVVLLGHGGAVLVVLLQRGRVMGVVSIFLRTADETIP